VIVVYLPEESEIELENIHSNFEINFSYYSKIIPIIIKRYFVLSILSKNRITARIVALLVSDARISFANAGFGRST
jgi:hypothetical protein